MALGEANMDVRKLMLAVALLGTIACQSNKSADQVANYKNGVQSGTCPTEAMVKSRFLVKYEDGRVEVIEAENETVFEKDFLEPNLQLIKRVEYDSVVTLNEPQAEAGTPGDTVEYWGNDKIQAKAAWDEGIFGQGITVAVIDTAVDIDHPQLIPRFLKDGSGWDFSLDMNTGGAPPSKITDPDEYHGTHVAGIIAADPTAGEMTGVAPKANLMQASFIRGSGGSIGGAIKAINYATEHGAKIINASWGGPDCSQTLNETIAEVGKKGVLFVVASGNDGYDYDRLGPASYQYPAVLNLGTMISVAATDVLDALTSFSNRSYNFVHIAAPGSEIRSTVPKISDATGYHKLQGTSMATPFVSGAAALLWSAKPNATVAQIRQALLNSTDFRSYKVSTQGRLNVSKALSEIRRIVP
jgi:subtilisin family serine protease